MKKQSLKSNLFSMEQYQVAGDKIFGGTNVEDKCQTSDGKSDACDSFTSVAETVNTDWSKDVTVDKFSTNTGVTLDAAVNNDSVAVCLG